VPALAILCWPVAHKRSVRHAAMSQAR